jgi:hypothetical protein
MRQTVIVIAACAALQGASAQTVWRCGNAYSQQPCAGGAPVAASDARTPADRARAADVARNDWALADRLQKERLAQEKSAGKALIIAPPQPAAAAASAARKDKKAKKPDEFAAVDPASVKHKKKKAKKSAD